MKKTTKNYTQLARSYIFQRPAVRECLARGIINHSALARKICETHKIKQFDAVHAACKRFEQSVNTTVDRRIQSILQEAEIAVENNVSLLRVKRPRNLERLHQVQSEVRRAGKRCDLTDGLGVIYITVTGGFAQLVKDTVQHQLLDFEDSLGQIIVQTDTRTIAIRGVLGHIYSILSYYGVNIIAERVYWANHCILVEKKQVPQVIDILTNSISST